jgi:hypothetical protein
MTCIILLSSLLHVRLFFSDNLLRCHVVASSFDRKLPSNDDRHCSLPVFGSRMSVGRPEPDTFNRRNWRQRFSVCSDDSLSDRVRAVQSHLF